MGRRPRRRVQRPRPVPARIERGRKRSDAGHRVPHAAQRRQRQICASRWPLRRQAGHADRRDIGRPGAERRHQSGAGRDRSSRDRVSSARVPRDLQIHRGPRTTAPRDRAGSAGQTERAGDGHAGRRPDQPSGVGCIGRCLSRLRRDRRTQRRPDPLFADRRRWPLGSGAGRPLLVSRNRADIAGLDHDAFLPFAVPALLRHRASARRARRLAPPMPARAPSC